jgi:hypothetical protein
MVPYPCLSCREFSENNSLIRSMELCIAQYRSEGNPYLVEFTGGPTFSV